MEKVSREARWNEVLEKLKDFEKENPNGTLADFLKISNNKYNYYQYKPSDFVPNIKKHHSRKPVKAKPETQNKIPKEYIELPPVSPNVKKKTDHHVDSEKIKVDGLLKLAEMIAGKIRSDN